MFEKIFMFLFHPISHCIATIIIGSVIIAVIVIATIFFAKMLCGSDIHPNEPGRR